MSHFGEGSSPNYDVYVRGSRDAEVTRIGEGQAQQFSPDSNTALAVIHGPPSRLVIHPVGPGDTKTVATGNVLVTEARWFPDGKRLLIMGAEPAKGRRAYVTDIAEFNAAGAAVGAAWGTTLGKHFPAMTLVQVSALIDPQAKVEIEGEAILP